MTRMLSTLLFLAVCISAHAQEFAHPYASVGEITASYGNQSSLGSGTLIGVIREEDRGVVATCAHLFRDGQPQEIVVAFPSGAHRAIIHRIDMDQDLCLLLITAPDCQPVKIGPPTQEMMIAGYGGRKGLMVQAGRIGEFYSGGRFRQVAGAQARSGDSGGAVFNKYGELSSVLWGANTEGTMASSHERFTLFCSAASRYIEKQCPGGVCQPGWSSRPSRNPGYRIVSPYKPPPSRPGTRPGIAVPVQPQKPQEPAGCAGGCGEKIAEIDKKLDQLMKMKGTPGPQGPPGPMGPPGKDGNNADTEDLKARLDKLESRMEDCCDDDSVLEPGGEVIYYVLVADREASYWGRMKSYYERASEAYSKIKVVPPPNFPVGQLPQLVAYKGGVPLGSFTGSQSVENALAGISRGNVPMPK